METLSVLPIPFFLSVLALAALAWVALEARRQGWGIPFAMVLGTTAVWYHGDALYNDYEEYRILMGDAALEAVWWQVLLFLIALGFAVPLAHRLINARLGNRRSQFMRYLETRRLVHPVIQRRIDRLASIMVPAWLVLMGIGLYRVDFDFIGLFAPYLGEKANPWSRGRIGAGFDAVFSLAGYVQLFLAAGFGVLAAVARNPRTQGIALVICFLSFPFYLFDRTRNTMVASMLPGMLAFILFRVKGGLFTKAVVLLGAFLLVNFWFSFVIANRTGGSIAGQLQDAEAIERAADARHEGLSMFSELGYINDYFGKGTLEPDGGRRYFAELVNPVPRALWKNKPMVGIDYAVARGFGVDDGAESGAGVTASIATGMIGQGVVNFGRVLGPIAAAILMACWIAVLARQDLLGQDPAHMLLFAVGMILTFNMGRDITLLVLYPFVFGWILLKLHHWYEQQRNGGEPRRPIRNNSRRKPVASKVARHR